MSGCPKCGSDDLVELAETTVYWVLTRQEDGTYTRDGTYDEDDMAGFHNERIKCNACMEEFPEPADMVIEQG